LKVLRQIETRRLRTEHLPRIRGILPQVYIEQVAFNCSSIFLPSDIVLLCYPSYSRRAPQLGHVRLYLTVRKRRFLVLFAIVW